MPRAGLEPATYGLGIPAKKSEGRNRYENDRLCRLDPYVDTRFRTFAFLHRVITVFGHYFAVNRGASQDKSNGVW